jgi:hypothetical protein
VNSFSRLSLSVSTIVAALTIVATGRAQNVANLTGTIQPTSISISTAATGETRIRFEIVVQNIGTAAVTSALRVKPFIIPNENHPYHSNNANGMVLPTLTSNVSISPAGIAAITYEGLLPVDRAASYLLAAVINPDHSIAESSQLDNATDLVSIGQLNPTTYVVPAGFDIYTEVPNGLDFRYGGVSHQLRTNMRGTGWPTASSPDEDLWARFMLADIQTKKVYTLPYTSDIRMVDKQWYAIAWHSELEQNGNGIVVDYYSQAPTLQHVPPGKYKFLLMMNTRDLVAENNPYNNLESRPLNLKALNMYARGTTGSRPLEQIWMVQKASDSAAATFSGELWTPYSTAANFSFAGMPEWLTATPATGSVGGNGTTAPVAFATNVARGTEAARSATVSLVSDRFATPAQVPVKFFSWGSTAPVLSLSTQSLTFNSTQTVYPAAQTVTISNTGTAPMEWAIDNSSNWVVVSPAAGTLAAGQSQIVTVGVHPQVLSPWGLTEARLTVLSSAQNNHPELSVNLNLTVR